MNLSKRLNRLAEMVTEGSRLADVGTDHGYVPLCLCRRGSIPSAIAMDVNEGPLARAEAHIREAGLENYIETRLSDGLWALRPGEADTVLIAGMGGALTERILSEGAEPLKTVRELVLQPQSEIWRVRRWLFEHDWEIVCEDIVLDEGKYYPMFRAVKGRGEAYSQWELLYGKSALQRSKKVLAEFLKKKLMNLRKIEAGLPRAEAAAGAPESCWKDGAAEDLRLEKRRAELAEEIWLLEQSLSELKGGSCAAGKEE